MKKAFIITITSIISAFGISVFALPAQAQIVEAAKLSTSTPTIVQPPSCGVATADFKALVAIQNNPNLSVADELNQELALRKQILTKILTCAGKEATSLQAGLDAITVTGDAASTQAAFDGKIKDALNFYSNESTKLANAGIRTTETIAQETLAWRAANFTPLQDQIRNFILWVNNQSLFQTADDRLAKTQRVVDLIESAAPNGELQASLADARASLADAEDQNTAALNSLNQFQPADQSFALIAESLQSLADTYQKFTNLNALIQKVLPTTGQ